MRNDNKLIFPNTNELYDKHFKDRGVNFISQYGTPRLRYPTPEQISNLILIGHNWTVGDRFFKLAHKHYGEAELWWVIAWFNETPTEAHLEIGDFLYIPTPLDRILDYYGY